MEKLNCLDKVCWLAVKYEIHYMRVQVTLMYLLSESNIYTFLLFFLKVLAQGLFYLRGVQHDFNNEELQGIQQIALLQSVSLSLNILSPAYLYSLSIHPCFVYLNVVIYVFIYFQF